MTSEVVVLNSDPTPFALTAFALSSRLAKSTTMRQSCRASPGAGTAGRTRLMRRSLLVTVPSFSPQVVAGSSRSAKSQVAAVA